MRVGEIRTLFDYSTWATGRILAAAAGLTDAQFVAPGTLSHGGVRGTLVHALSTEHAWRTGWQGLPRPPRLNDDDYPTVAALAARWAEEEAERRAYLDTLTDADLDRDFFDLGPIWQVMLHLANHSTQHRSEAAILLTDLGHSPGDIDIVFFLIERQQGKG